MAPGPQERSPHPWGADDSQTPILHVDMDAFFAAVELLERPDLRGAPVIVGGQHRGVVLAATYEARRFGVHSAMPIAQARALAPQATILTPHHDKYRAVSARVMDLLRSVTPLVEQISIDEAFLDVAGARRRLGTPAHIARRIRARVATEIGVVASVGVAANKFVAKLASHHAKPDGYLLVPAPATVEFLHSLPVGELWGVGGRTEERLAQAGIRTVEDLAHAPAAHLRRLLGEAGAQRLRALAWGEDPRPVQVERRDKSVGHEQTFFDNLTDPRDLHAVLLDQAHRCAARLRAGAKLGATVALKVRFADFTTITRSITLPNPTDVAHEIYQAAVKLLANVTIPPGGVRLLGTRCEGLTDAATTAIQPQLGEFAPQRREAERAMDAIAAKYGPAKVRAGSLISPPATRNGGRGIS